MANADRSRKLLVFERSGEIVQLADGPDQPQSLSVMHRNAGRVVASIFQAPQTI
jgi:hypothetical protein